MSLPTTDDGSNPYGIVCPTCGAKPGEPCTSRNRRYPHVYLYPHITRQQKASDRVDFGFRRDEARRAILRRRLDAGDRQWWRETPATTERNTP